MSIHFGRIITGDIFVLCQATRERLFREYQALAIEMEGAALAQVAQRFGRQCLIVRVIGDLAGGGPKLDEDAKLKRLDVAADFVESIVITHGRRRPL
jgi:nucleoside phosphorylase